MKTFKEMKLQEQKEAVELFSNWLKSYTQEVIMRVMEKAEDILNDDFSMRLLRELYTREQNEKEDFSSSINNLFSNFNALKEYNPHNHPLEHAQSYRDVLYDMYIKQIKVKEEK